MIGRNMPEAKIHTVPSIYIFDKEVATNACEFGMKKGLQNTSGINIPSGENNSGERRTFGICGLVSLRLA